MKKLSKPIRLQPYYEKRVQTGIKHLILERYLERVAWNILYSQNEFVFVDGNSGPWKSNSDSYADTSFGIAMRILRRVRDELKGGHGRQREVRCVFVEKHKPSFTRLEAAVRSATYIDGRAIHGQFEDCVEQIYPLLRSAFALIFIDPTGWSFDLHRLAPLLRRRPSEVIVNFMFEHVNRFLDDVRPEIQASYGLPFGDRDWRQRFEALQTSGLSREEAVLELFRERLRTIGEFDYVLTARIQRATSDRSHFYLVYGTRNPKGLIEFRSVERKAVEAEELARIEAKHEKRASKSTQGLLHVSTPRSLLTLRQPDIERATVWICQRLFKTKVLSYKNILIGVLERFAVTESELKDALVVLKNNNKVTFLGMGPRQRKPGDKVNVQWLDADNSQAPPPLSNLF